MDNSTGPKNVKGILMIGIVTETNEVVVNGALAEKKLCLAVLRQAFKIVRNFKASPIEVVKKSKIIVPGARPNLAININRN